MAIFKELYDAYKKGININNYITENKNLISKVKKCDFIFFLAFDVGGSRYLKKYQNTYIWFISNFNYCRMQI